MGLILKYVQEPNQGRESYRYRRRVQAPLKPYLQKGELIAVLGNSRQEALKAYPAIHAAFEREIEIAKKQLLRDQRRSGVDGGSTKLERYNELINELKGLGISDPHSGASTESEDVMRSVLIDGIANKYPIDEETGYPMVSSSRDTFLIRSLASKAPPPPPATLEDAKRLYVEERLSGTDFEFRKKLRRVERIVEAVNTALDTVPPLNQWTRDHAKKVRDYYIHKKGLKPASVKRELNTLKGVFSCYIQEKEAHFNNPFKGIELPKSVDAPVEERDPFPPEILLQVRQRILDKSNQDIKLIWRLLEGTGCRLAEITGLRVVDVFPDDELPHLKIIVHTDRRLKTASSSREVPLIGDALSAAREALVIAGDRDALFERYIKPTGSTSASAAMMKHVRLVTDNPRLVVHSLRHNMSDRLALAEVPTIDKNSILGHLNAGVGEQHYGGKYAKLRILTKAMNKAFSENREKS